MQKAGKSNQADVIVVGAGAAGLLAAGRAAECGARVLLLEKNARPGRKILITGKGRCNITNEASRDEFFSQISPRPRFLKHAFTHFFNTDIVLLLENHGLKCKTERGGRVFPETDRASDVADALWAWIQKNQVRFLGNETVSRLLFEDEPHRIHGVETTTGDRFFAPSVLLTTGGKSYPATGSDGQGYALARTAGHSISPVRPALVPVETREDTAARMQGLSLKNIRASLWCSERKLADEFGELLFTHFGLSGPVILSLSREAGACLERGELCRIHLDLKPALDHKQLQMRMLRDIESQGKKQMGNMLRQYLPSSMISVILQLSGIPEDLPALQLNAIQRKKLIGLMKDWPFTISRLRPFKEAVITCGGIPTEEVQGRSMASKLTPGLFFAGEILDLDAMTGGFNLQIAWSSGYLAGEHAARYAENLRTAD